MQNKQTYEYAVIRLVPRVEREEFMNIGVILFSKRKKYLDIRYKVDAEKVAVFAPHIDPQMIENYLAAWQAVCAGAPAGGVIGTLDRALRFRWLTASRSSVIQSSRPHPGLCEEPEKVLEELYGELVC